MLFRSGPRSHIAAGCRAAHVAAVTIPDSPADRQPAAGPAAHRGPADQQPVAAVFSEKHPRGAGRGADFLGRVPSVDHTAVGRIFGAVFGVGGISAAPRGSRAPAADCRGNNGPFPGNALGSGLGQASVSRYGSVPVGRPGTHPRKDPRGPLDPHEKFRFCSCGTGLRSTPRASGRISYPRPTSRLIDPAAGTW